MKYTVPSVGSTLTTYFTRGLALLIGIAVYPVTIRLIGIAQRRRTTAA